ncbi:TonB-dependent receptor plug domain-containing protein [Polymorphobacter fuscus]|uniref:TonB-dependent receptor n=1 Tax=Sandarakinorhabdus fusca TaxID=1439888 RepID=A0A7C9KVP6_9SPHN|nr:TonB-dependent receptor [Polymorphobacter fuscus]KAB7648540.1 TonB-dependent receptor [Polymorphobacter fuscus]MQT16082.1 TonB-dependent receptor [Polymorphobacter fuscus]NJC07639.1 vitamin B12 transporter [Polymorphobacter fuscus]
MRFFLSVLLTTAISAPALALDAPDDTIVVTANRSPQPLSRVGQSISIVDSGEITRRQTVSVVDILRTLPGVSIARNGGIGTATSVFIRGADSDQTVALIDGVKLNDPSSPGGGFNFGNLLVGNIDRIEVLRGSQSVLWGSQAIGGVINMITRPPTEDLAINARGEYGFRNTAQLVGNVSGKAGPLSASAGAGYFRTDGISSFSEARGGRERDGYDNFSANGNLNLALTDAISIDARGWYVNGKVGIDGFPPPSFAFGDTLEVSKTREIVAYTGLNAAFLDGRFRNRLGFAFTDTHRTSNDQGTETFASDGRNERLEYQGVFDIADGWQATAGLERETSRFNTSSYGGPVTRGRARIDSVYGQLVATPVAGLTLTGGVRHDDHNRFGGATTFGGSGVYTVAATGTAFRASYSEGFKAPSLYQLQSEYGNQLLQPERSKGWDAGITQTMLDGALEASATYFKRDSTNLIAFVSCTRPLTGICAGRPSGTYDNVARARADGVEVGLALRPVEALRVQANYTYTNAVNRSPGNANFGKLLVRRPQQSVSTLVDYRWPFGLETGATVTHVGRSFDNAANTTRVQGYVLADVRAAFPITRNIELYGRVENLFDERYETVIRYGQPGRAGYAGVRVTY